MIDGNKYPVWDFTELRRAKEIRVLTWLTNGLGIALWQVALAVAIAFLLFLVNAVIGLLSTIPGAIGSFAAGVALVYGFEQRETHGKDLKRYLKDMTMGQFKTTLIVDRQWRKPPARLKMALDLVLRSTPQSDREVDDGSQ